MRGALVIFIVGVLLWAAWYYQATVLQCGLLDGPAGPQTARDQAYYAFWCGRPGLLTLDSGQLLVAVSIIYAFGNAVYKFLRRSQFKL